MTHDDFLKALEEHYANAARLGTEAERQHDYGAALYAVEVMRETHEKIYVVSGMRERGVATKELLLAVRDSMAPEAPPDRSMS